MERRDFLKGAGLALASGPAWNADRAIALSVNAGPVTSAAPVEWAIGELRKAIPIRDDAKFRVHLGGPESAKLPETPESFQFVPGLNTLSVWARDPRGMVYALLELAARANQESFGIHETVTESPGNAVRSVARFFVSDVEDKPWYYDRAMWPAYLSMLAAQRFNRFNLTLGIGYDFARQIRDCYLHFPYPFLMAVNGYNVRAKGLPDSERDLNFDTLKFIAKETVARGLDFHLALWTHAYKWEDSPNANYIIEGLSPENHAAYCRDALRRVLDEVPQITGLTFRVHGESGVAEGSYDFWKTLFSAASATGRKISLDLHAKGIDRRMIDTALDTGLPVTVSPKFMAEHMGLPYQQAGIRELEMPPREAKPGFFALSDGERKFMRYSYGDLFDEKRKYSVMFRIWPGTQRLLLWGDPEFAAAYSRAFQFCGATGVEWCEPLSFKGRKGGGLAGGRTGYADRSLTPKWDWQKYEYAYKLWGRMLYNPAADIKATTPAETALAYSSRILPLITSAHGPSAANNNYWPEMYTNMSIVDATVRNPYGDSPAPRRFGTVSPFDPEMFSTIEESAAGKGGARYSPLQVAAWLDDLAQQAMANLGKGSIPRAWRVDIEIQAGIGRFFAAKFRSALLWSRFERDGDRASLEAAIAQYKLARAAWASSATAADGVYRRDLSYGYEYQLRGHWMDRLPAIDEDIARMEQRLAGAKPSQGSVGMTRPKLREWPCSHTVPPRFTPGKAIAVALLVKGEPPKSVVLRYRRVNQVERFVAIPMTAGEGGYRAEIPAEYTRSPFPVQYYFELDGAGMYPGIGPNLSGQPYFVVRQA
uniref:Uncharacterized protein n=1 Tax=Solibacter usitatus (strain Ellin6076) TaxID=234267 RepID=Q021F1_SOLUE